MAWDKKTYHQRIESIVHRTRHAAGSPHGEELIRYREACGDLNPAVPALVLGMTPELREIAARHFEKTFAIDHSRDAIELFSDWLPEELSGRETILHGCWTTLESHLSSPLIAILGDGIIGNLSGPEATLGFLRQLHALLADGGLCVMRNIILTPDLNPEDYRFEKLLSRFRDRQIDAAEFGFTSRILGFHDEAYSQETETLDNAIVYTRLDAMRENGELDDVEWNALSRYRFSGKNYFPTSGNWETLIEEAGFQKPRHLPTQGKLWHAFYPLHVLQK
ncbi:MAG: hypothetical protein QM627_09945 [Luteolibacter sp.]